MRLFKIPLIAAFSLCIFKFAYGQTELLQIDDVVVRGVLTEAGLELEVDGLVRIDNRKGARIALLSGSLALLEQPEVERGELVYSDNTYNLGWDRRGDFRFHARFLAEVEELGEVRQVSFRLLHAPMRRLELAGFAQEDALEIDGAAPPQREGDRWITHLSPTSQVNLRWQPAAAEEEGELFYAIDETTVAAIAAGLVKQNHRLKVQVMQGALRSIELALEGPGEVAEVDAADLLGGKRSNVTDNACFPSPSIDRRPEASKCSCARRPRCPRSPPPSNCSASDRTPPPASMATCSCSTTAR